ncbi:MAG: TetR family transcriptional regulator [Acidobacteriaceae bacterium]|nr:TetR family transcriptional regulator [Acidobacteriaceae bacterium]
MLEAIHNFEGDSGCRIDPRIRRTRHLLQQALEKLLEAKDFESISVQDITEAATLNRATFYDHYSDKFALLECLVARQFLGLLAQRDVKFDGSCPSALRGIVLGVCDYVAGIPGTERQRQLEPHLESAVVSVVRQMILEGLRQHSAERKACPEMIAATAAWAIYGAAKEWARMPERVPSEEIADTIMGLALPIFGVDGAAAVGHHQTIARESLHR